MPIKEITFAKAIDLTLLKLFKKVKMFKFFRLKAF